MTDPHEVRVLLVEDNPTDVLAFRQYLSELPEIVFKVESAERLEQALAFLRTQTCDVVLLDLGLPDSQGLETLNRLRASASDVPVLVLTGLSDESVGLKALQSGAQDYLVKNHVQAPLLNRAIRYALERHQMERTIMRAEKLQALGTLAGGIAHDFNNILLAVSGNAKLALEQLSPEHPAYAHVLEIAKAGSRAVALTKKILSFSRQQEIALQPTQIEPVVEEAVSLIRPMMPLQIEVSRHFPPDLPAIKADASQIHQIIMNLATNAVDAIGEKPGRLEISAVPVHLPGSGSTLSSKLPPGNYIRLSFQDSGPGIDKAIQSRIFEPFFTTKAQGRGTGMGLAIVHGIMKNHFGEVTVYSEPGKGTAFNLYFPVAAEDPAALPAAAPAPAGQGQHIIYVDDEEPLVWLVTRTLKRLGYEVTGFTGPVEALRLLRERPRDFQAVVTDLAMPQMSGTEFAHEVLQTCPGMPVILITGYIGPQDQEMARRVGVRELILKPDSVEELGNALHRILSGSAPGTPIASGSWYGIS